VALRLARERPAPLVVADLGTGSGAIALGLATELGSVEATVWACDESPDALAVAQANLAGIGRAAVNVRVAEGSWYDALPPGLRGRLGLVVSNPPYLAPGDPDVEPAVRRWEPAGALFSGEDGLDALRRIVGGAPTWLEPGGAVTCEIGARQGPAVARLAEDAGLVDVRIEPDLAGFDRFLLARRASS
jgi:release factor glutamine methyltransferase